MNKKPDSLELAGKIIDLMIKEGFEVNNNPYMVEHFAEKFLCNHSNLWATGRFKEE